MNIRKIDPHLPIHLLKETFSKLSSFRSFFEVRIGNQVLCVLGPVVERLVRSATLANKLSRVDESFVVPGGIVLQPFAVGGDFWRKTGLEAYRTSARSTVQVRNRC
jgi:hypothetical protein